MIKPITVDSVYLPKEGSWLREGGNTPWSWVNAYGYIEKIHVTNNTITIKLTKRHEIEIPRDQCWIFYKTKEDEE